MTSETDTTGANGAAASSVFTANSLTGTYTVTAALQGGTIPPASFSLTNTSSTQTSQTFVFYLMGEELNGTSFYALAGAVQIDQSGTVLGGVQDYNDGNTIGSPEPSGDAITGGTLTVDTTVGDATFGQGTLTLQTDNPGLGAGGIETLGVQFVNAQHALIIQFDGTATSSGSFDLQTLPTTPLSGGYAFTLTGLDPFLGPATFGGVFTISGGTNLTNGLYDTNDSLAEPPLLSQPLTGTISSIGQYGRGTISSTLTYLTTGSPTPIALNYYVVGPEVLRIIDVDNTNNGSGSATSDTVIGSAFGQGANATGATNASLGSSVFGIDGVIANSPLLYPFAAAGMFSTTSSSGSFSGFADEDELITQTPVTGTSITGNYSIASNGYGNLTIDSGTLGNMSALGLYMTDPTLNLSDPNNTNPNSGLGGALLADMDYAVSPLIGAGIVIPQTDPSAASFTGPYAFWAQDYNFLNGPGGEVDFVGVGTVSSLTLTNGTGLVSDPTITLGAGLTNTGVAFSGTAVADSGNPGRYTIPLSIDIYPASPFGVTIYQAVGGQLFWINDDVSSTFLGLLEQQGSLTGIPAARKGPRSGARKKTLK
jgi:hypothetical protein